MYFPESVRPLSRRNLLHLVATASCLTGASVVSGCASKETPAQEVATYAALAESVLAGVEATAPTLNSLLGTTGGKVLSGLESLASALQTSAGTIASETVSGLTNAAEQIEASFSANQVITEAAELAVDALKAVGPNPQQFTIAQVLGVVATLALDVAQFGSSTVGSDFDRFAASHSVAETRAKIALLPRYPH